MTDAVNPEIAVDRENQLRDNLRAVRERIQTACVAAGRAEDAVTLVAITKTFPISDVRALAALGVRDLGENREQELKVKAPDCQDVVGSTRPARYPAPTPTSTGTARNTTVHPGAQPSSGSAASTGTDGTGPSVTSAGETIVSAPNANPGPSR